MPENEVLCGLINCKSGKCMKTIKDGFLEHMDGQTETHFHMLIHLFQVKHEL